MSRVLATLASSKTTAIPRSLCSFFFLPSSLDRYESACRKPVFCIHHTGSVVNFSYSSSLHFSSGTRDIHDTRFRGEVLNNSYMYVDMTQHASCLEKAAELLTGPMTVCQHQQLEGNVSAFVGCVQFTQSSPFFFLNSQRTSCLALYSRTSP